MIASTLEAFSSGVIGPATEIKLLLKPWEVRFSLIHCPVHIWQGTLDTQVPITHAKVYAKLIPGSELKIVEGEEHHSLIRSYAELILNNLEK